MTQTPDPQPADTPIERLSELVAGVEVAMLTTIGPDGKLYSRPMATLELDANGVLWFFTRRSSGKVDSIEEHQNVNLSFGSPEDHRYVSVTGKAKLVDDPAKALELWKPSLRAFFPRGLDDPDVTLLQVKVDGAEYWDSPSSWIVKMLGFVEGRGLPKVPSSAAENERIEVTRH